MLHFSERYRAADDDNVDTDRTRPDFGGNSGGKIFWGGAAV
jgi:hypothetical protein